MNVRRLFLLILLACCTAACWDFLEPDFPEAGAPAVLQASVYMDEAGHITVNALLVPGLAIGGVQRRVANDTLDIFGVRITPSEVRRNGTRVYVLDDTLDAMLAKPLELRAPQVQDITGPPPQVRWFGIRSADSDTISWRRGTDLVLHVDTAVGRSTPLPAIRQWFLDLRGSDRTFRISSDGPPPPDLRIPAEWVPASDQGVVTAVLAYFQSGQQQSPSRDYIGNILFNMQIRWIISVAE